MEVSPKALVFRSFLSELPIMLGLSREGKFLVGFQHIAFKEVTETNQLSLIRLLGIGYTDFCEALDSMILEFNQQDNSHSASAIRERFPFIGIMRVALTSGSSYWVELAFGWMSHVGKEHFLVDLESIVQNKRLSQSVRHRARKFLPLPDFRNRNTGKE